MFRGAPRPRGAVRGSYSPFPDTITPSKWSSPDNLYSIAQADQTPTKDARATVFASSSLVAMLHRNEAGHTSPGAERMRISTGNCKLSGLPSEALSSSHKH